MELEETWSNICKETGIDSRIEEALFKMGIRVPTSIQMTFVRRVFERRDIVVQSPTGSGKTLAYLVPLVHMLLDRKKNSTTFKPCSSLILVPTRELCSQVHNVALQLLECSRSSLVSTNDKHKYVNKFVYQRGVNASFVSLPEILITTPLGFQQILDGGRYSVTKNIERLVLDEVDLMLAYQQNEALGGILKTIRSCQHLLFSATIDDLVSSLRNSRLIDPIVIDMSIPSNSGISSALSTSTTSDSTTPKLKQFYIKLQEDDKYLIFYSLLKFRFLDGKILIFTSNVFNAYKYKLFSDKFYLGLCAVYDYELSISNRLRILEDFSNNLLSCLICVTSSQNAEKYSENSRRSKSSTTKDTDGDISENAIERGIDFKGVNCVLNVDQPVSWKNYKHMIGRTARGGATGVSLTFVTDPEKWDKLLCDLNCVGGNSVLNSVTVSGDNNIVLQAEAISPVSIRMGITELELRTSDFLPLQYRVKDVARSVTPKAVYALRHAELLGEILSSQTVENKISQSLLENPADIRALRISLRRDGLKMRSIMGNPHLAKLPENLIPQTFLEDANQPNSETTDGVHFENQTCAFDNSHNNPVRKALAESNQLVPISDQTSKHLIRMSRKYLQVSANKTDDLRARMIRKEPDHSITHHHNLPPISGKKLWKIRHGIRVQKDGSSSYGIKGRDSKGAKKRSRKELSTKIPC